MTEETKTEDQDLEEDQVQALTNKEEEEVLHMTIEEVNLNLTPD